MLSTIFMKDGYKADHRSQYPKGTEYVYANFTPRGSRIEGQEYVVVFGIQYLLRHFFQEEFQRTFFARPKAEVLDEYQEIMSAYLGVDEFPVDHLADLHDLGYLPLEIKALPEGTKCPIKVPFMTIVNTDPKFFWLTNMLETLISTTLWHPITSATTADRYRKLFEEFAINTTGSTECVPFQGHDFSMRGLPGNEAATVSAAAHLTSFVGTDTIPSIPFLKKYYDASGFIGCSVPATEHSVMCLGEKESEIDTFKRLITEVYPSGIVSIVSDTWDFWKVVSEYLPTLKDDIEARDGKVVIRPDSGDPANIICGTVPEVSKEEFDRHSGFDSVRHGDQVVRMECCGTHGRDLEEVYREVRPSDKGLIECLWDTFGGIINKQGYKVLDPCIGAIYGDSITYERAQDILQRLEAKGFASSNIVFGIGSYTYQYVTRDTHGFAVKATMGIVNGEQRNIFKDPKTDNGLKKSARGLLHVTENLELIDDCTEEQEQSGELKCVFYNGSILHNGDHPDYLSAIRERIRI